MYCTNCGKQNDDSVRFCNRCGNSLTVRENPQPNGNSSILDTAKAKISSLNKKHLLIIGCVLLVAIIIICVVSCSGNPARGANSPKSLAKRYVEAINSEDIKNLEACFSEKIIDYYSDEWSSSNLKYVLCQADNYYDFFNYPISNYEMEISECDDDYWTPSYVDDNNIKDVTIVSLDFYPMGTEDRTIIEIFCINEGGTWYVSGVRSWSH